MRQLLQHLFSGAAMLLVFGEVSAPNPELPPTGTHAAADIERGHVEAHGGRASFLRDFGDIAGRDRLAQHAAPEPKTLQAAPGPTTVTVTVEASDPNPLTYRWRSSDGQIVDQNAPATTWTLPDGPGIHFAYVLVANGMGGYTERRIAVNTDDLGSPVAVTMPVAVSPPSAPASAAVPFRTWLGAGTGSYDLGGTTKPFKVALPDVAVRSITLQGPIVSEHSVTRLQGDLTLHNFAPQPFSNIGRNCTIQGAEVFDCFGLNTPPDNQGPAEVIDVEANQTNRIDLVPSGGATFITGSVRLEDGSACGTENEFFGVSSSASVQLLDINGVPLAGTQTRANSWGQFSVALRQAIHVDVQIQCEGVPPFIPPGTGTFDLGVITIPGVRAPLVSNMTSDPIRGVFPVPGDAPVTGGLPSDIVPLRPAKFLAMKGLDTRLDACRYYKALGAVADCDAEGNFQRAVIRFDDWKRTVGIDQFRRPGARQDEALFVNLLDLNLTREHHFVSYGATDTSAGYVCNHTGPKSTDRNDPTGLLADQTAIDAAIDDAAAGRNLVACVAMEYSVTPGVNDDKPFTRFFIFGPSGDLLPSVNLDGRGEKFVPGTCVVCHGGNRYAGEHPADSASPDLEAHFLPFDTANFGFHSTNPSLTKDAQQQAISNLNHAILNTNPTSALVELVNGWYKTGLPQDERFIPDNIMGQAFRDFYKNVIARSCRTCHIALRDEQSILDLNFSVEGVNLGGPPKKPLPLSKSILKELVCGNTDDLVRAYSMPNSAVTFDRFWLSRGTANDQVQALGAQIGEACTNPRAP
jgi:hypothetical protein